MCENSFFFLLCALICDAQYRSETSVISPVMLTVLYIGVRVVWEYSRCQHMSILQVFKFVIFF